MGWGGVGSKLPQTSLTTKKEVSTIVQSWFSLTWDARGAEALGVRPLLLAQERAGWSTKVDNEVCGRVAMMMGNGAPLCGLQFSLLLTTVVVKPWASYLISLALVSLLQNRDNNRT